MTAPHTAVRPAHESPFSASDRLRVVRLASVFEPLGLASGWTAFDPIGGMQNHTAELVRRLDAMGIGQTVFTSRMAGPACRQRLGARSAVMRTGVRVPVMRQFWAAPALTAALRAPGGVDLVHAHAGEDLAVLPMARAVAARHGCPLVVTLHCSLRHTLRGHSPRARLLRFLGGPIESRVVRSADAVINLTPSTALRLVRQGVREERVHVVPSGYAPELFDAALPDPFPHLPRPRVAFVGRLSPQKDVGTLIEAFSRLETAASLLVVGDGPQRAALQERARPVPRPVQFAGFLPHGEIPAILAHTDVVVLPSVYEELGSVLVEAMAAGRPVVASRVGGIPDLVQDGRNGILAAPGDTSSFASAIDRLLGDPDGAARLGEAARLTVSRTHAWPKLARQVADVYREVLDRRTGARRT
ncbi:glycosyltransferase family 4 protein [Streptomyces sp. TRM70350]|uniref:glycosyltransferase family 4 protein n=1 Tax=Streptomyces sp. TRM70350 TaxID=2856165 RepID=UPI001C44D7D0|nr:glycosyltransferase family 4 protein [Streptomyces sp. TRM70350]MBV7694121.1 glycosyltransferase family 4 protein [Streptomyces sp. TRM70350]